MEPLWISLLTVLIAAGVASLLSAIAARIRFSTSRGLGSVLDLIFLLPLAIPEIMAFFVPHFICDMLGTMPRNSAPTPVIIITELFWTLPVFYLCAIMGFRKVSQELIDAARLQGLRSCGIFFRVFFPQGYPWLLGGFIIGLSRGIFVTLMKYAMAQA